MFTEVREAWQLRHGKFFVKNTFAQLARKKDADGEYLCESIEDRWVKSPRYRESLNEILDRPSTRIAAEEKLAAKARAEAQSQPWDERTQRYENMPQIRTQSVQSGQQGGGSNTTRLRGAKAFWTVVEAVKGKGKGKTKDKGKDKQKGKEQQKWKAQESRDAPFVSATYDV